MPASRCDKRAKRAIWDGWANGYADTELRAAEARFSFRFPPDVFEFLQHRRLPNGYDWAVDDDAIITMLGRPLDGILFDVENDALWWPEWGKRPASPAERADVVSKVVNAAPKLIPLYGHRYIAEMPSEAGNPVFSVMQADIIHYGMDLMDYFHHEFGDRSSYIGSRQAKRIPFWSDAVDRAWDPAFTWPNVG